tara:strand:- start:1098 stop:1367 length:270 start_codon:yes stop_codon:yes gene_type:complete
MIRNLFFLFLGAFSGLWFIWPQIITTKGWECTKEVIASSNEELTDIESLVESLPNRLKLGLSISPKTLLKRENLTRIEKLRIVGDACFR